MLGRILTLVVMRLAAAPIVVDASMLNGGASGLLNLVAIAGPNGQILLQQLPAVRLATCQLVPFLFPAFQSREHSVLLLKRTHAGA